MTTDDIDLYAEAYSAPGALRAALRMYEALPFDRELNLRALATGKLEMPVTAIGSGMTSSQPTLEAVLDEVASNGDAVLFEQSGHWIPQEAPSALADILERVAGPRSEVG